MTQPTASHVSDQPDQPAYSQPVTDHRQMVKPQKDQCSLAHAETAPTSELIVFIHYILACFVT